jgi:hypothetical protein
MNSSVLKGSAVLVAIGAAQDTETVKLSAKKKAATHRRTAGAGHEQPNILELYESGERMSTVFDCTSVRGFRIIARSSGAYIQIRGRISKLDAVLPTTACGRFESFAAKLFYTVE